MPQINMDYRYIFDWVWHTSAKLSILIILILLVKHVLKNQISARLHYLLWLVVIVSLPLLSPWTPRLLFDIESLNQIATYPFIHRHLFFLCIVGIAVFIDATVLIKRKFTAPYLKKIAAEQFTIKDNNAAEKAAWELYSKLQAPPEYKLISLKMGKGGDFWTATWQKEVIPGVFSGYESVNLMFSSDKGELTGYNLFNTPAKSLEVKVTQDQAVNIARTIAEAKGFSRFRAANLEVEQPNNYLEGSTKRLDYVTLIWAVTYKNSQSKLGKTMVVYVDSSTGLVVGVVT